MQRAALLLEAYVPGLGQRRPTAHDQLQASVAALLAQYKQAGVVVVMPEDEMVLVIAWHGAGTGRLPNLSAERVKMAKVVMRAEPGSVVQRIIEAQVILPTETE